MRISLALTIGFGLAVACRVMAAEEPEQGEPPWPGDALVVAGKATSPDGKYGIVVPSTEAGSDDEEANEDQLADLKAHRFLGKIPGVHYFERQNHRDLSAAWSADSSWCAAVYGARFGFGECVLLEPHGDRFTATPIGKEVRRALDAVIRKEAHDRTAESDVTLHVRPRANGALQVRALGSTNPKRLEGQKTYYAYLAGSYDLKGKRWTKLRAREAGEELDAVDAAFEWGEGELVRVVADIDAEQSDGFDGTVVTTEEAKAETLDRMLNEANAAVRAIVAPARFAKVKDEQRVWLARRDSEVSAEAKNKMTDARVRELRAVLWED